MAEFKNLDVKISYDTDRRRDKAALAAGGILGIIFLLTVIRTLAGGWYIYSSAGDMLNRIIVNMSVHYPVVHGYFEDTGGSLILVLLLLAAVIVCAGVTAAAAVSGGWYLPLIMAAAVLALDIVPGVPVYMLIIFFAAAAICLFTILSDKRANLAVTAIAAILIMAAVFGISMIPGDAPGSRLAEIAEGRQSESPLPGGDFSDLGEMDLSEKKAFDITMSEPQSYYLPVYRGDVFTGTGWEKLDGKTLSGYNDRFASLHQKGFFAYSQLDMAASAADRAYGKKDKKPNRITISNLKEKNRIYPYEVSGEIRDIKEIIGDEYFVPSEKAESYSFEAAENLTGMAGHLKQAVYDKQDSRALADYRLYESTYREFAEENFTEIDEKTEKILEKVLGKRENLSVSKVKEKTLQLFGSFKYDENVTYEVRDPENDNFLADFLEDKSGYSVHYATAATLIFRYYGIPARYTEGYIITPDDAAAMKKDKAYKIDRGHAHGWMEYYEDGTGWIPFETTGPYIGVMGSDDNISYNAPVKGQKQKANEKKEKENPKKHLIPEVKTSPYGVAAAIGLLILILLLIVLIARAVKKRLLPQKGTKLKDDNEAVIAMTSYIMKVLEKKGLERENIPVREYREKAEKLAGPEAGELFGRCAEIYEKASYSGKHISSEERQTVTELADNIKKYIKREEKRK